jgi:pyruvate-formate lyase-activating enzyme
VGGSALVHLAEYISLRPVPAAGVSLALTRRCPLHCAHCATNSTATSEEAPAELFTRFVGTFEPGDRPEVMAISGGEAFLRPQLVRELAERASAVGCRTIALSGMFWAKARRIPPPIKRAIDALDHFSVSLDVFHEQEVRREDVYRVLETLLGEGKDVSIHLVGLNAADPYIAERTEEVRGRFGDRVPILVNDVNFVGRAREWLDPANVGPPPSTEANPCTLSAWPVVAFDGTVVACGNDDVVDGPAPSHLRLGHAATDSWAVIRARTLASSMLRAIRTFGPEYVADRHGSGIVACDGYCSTCQRMAVDVALEPRVEELMSGAGGRLLEQQVLEMQRSAGPRSFMRRYGVREFADLALLGAPE